MGSRSKLDKLDGKVESSPLIRADRMTKESTQHPQIDEQAIVMEGGATTFTIELPRILQAPLERPNAFNTQ